MVGRDMRDFLERFRSEEDGATAIEYAVIAALVVLVAMAAMYQVGENTSDMWDNVAQHI